MRLKNSLHQQFSYLFLFVFGFGLQSGWAQAPDTKATPSGESSLADTVRQLQLQLQQLQTSMQEMKEETGRYRAETLQLRHELQAAREKLDTVDVSSTATSSPASSSAGPQEALHSQGESSSADTRTSDQRIAKLEEDQQLLAGKVEEQYQTKVESASKYRVRLSGMLLMNVFSNKGFVDHFEVPSIALPTTPSETGGNTGGSFGATFRQSQFGLEIHGPSLAGAKTSGDFVADFFGEFPETINGASSGALRLRTGIVRMDWSHTSLVAGQDSIFFSPLYPTSFASLAIPAFSYSGNLYGWMPQVRVEHRWTISEDSTVTLSGGILDPLTGETPPNEFLRQPGAGESGRQPGYGGRLAWSRYIFGQPFAIGAGGYYNRENWGFNRNINGWAATTDWIVPFGEYFSLSGKFYAGHAIGGLGAGMGRSVVFNGPLANLGTTVRGLQSIGGWAQIKFKPLAKLEFNAAAGQDNASAGDIRGFTQTTGYFDARLTRNRSEFANFIYQPRSNLLFSTEFRTLRTFAINGTSNRANQLNLIMGVLF
jgi:regulator of replication initiation timing